MTDVIRCMGRTRRKRKYIAHAKITKRVLKLHGKREELERKYGYLFREGVESLTTRSTQYLIKWLTSFRMAENIIARGKLKNKKGVPIGLRRGERKG